MKCPFCNENMLQPASLHITDAPGIQRKVEGGWVCGTCKRIFVHKLGPEQPMDLTQREIDMRRELLARITTLEEDLRTAGDTTQEVYALLESIREELKVQTELAETRIKMFNDMQAKFIEANSKYQSLKDRKAEE
jgi:hypothetical protein